MAMGLLMGAIALGLRGVGHVGHAIQDEKCKTNVEYWDTWDTYVYHDRHYDIHDAQTGRKIAKGEVKILQGTVFAANYVIRGSECKYKHGDTVIVDVDSKRIIKNLTAQKAVGKEEELRQEIEQIKNAGWSPSMEHNLIKITKNLYKAKYNIDCDIY